MQDERREQDVRRSAAVSDDTPPAGQPPRTREGRPPRMTRYQARRKGDVRDRKKHARYATTMRGHGPSPV